MAVTSSAPPDANIQREVLTELTFDPEVEQREIEVMVGDQVATLTGWVDSLPRKCAAERAALRVRGVKAVVNDVEVRLAAGDQRTDADIAAAAARALAWDTRVPADAVRVTTSDGCVTLRGEVDWQYQSYEAQRVVRNLVGVKHVTNLIATRPSDTPLPDYVKDRIVSAFVRNAQLDAQKITAQTDGGRVTLIGSVQSWVEAAEAERITWSTPGVTEVHNRIVVLH
jgi:osmotically-inducible protein OsmY